MLIIENICKYFGKIKAVDAVSLKFDKNEAVVLLGENGAGKSTLFKIISGFSEPDSGELMLGDIVISADKVISQAEEYGHSRKREYAFLIAHSMLHLMGFDHMTEEDAKEMERLQEEILSQLHISR